MSSLFSPSVYHMMVVGGWAADMADPRCGIINVGWVGGRPPLGASTAESDRKHFYEIIPTPARQPNHPIKLSNGKQVDCIATFVRVWVRMPT